MRKELALKVLLGMSAYHKAGMDAAQEAAVSTARSTRYDSEKAAEWAVWQLGIASAWWPAMLVSWQAAWHAARDAPRELARSAAWDAMSAARSAAMLVSRDAAGNILTQEDLTAQLGRSSSRVAEMAVNLYCLRNFDAILSGVFRALKDSPLLRGVEERLFASSESWADFKGEHFSTLKPAAQHFLAPWLEAIDGLMIPLAGSERGL